MMNFEGTEKLQNIIDEKDKEIERLMTSLAQEKEKNSELEKINEYHESLLSVLPGHAYWFDKNNVFMGCNDAHAEAVKLKSRKDIVGKTNYDVPWKDQAEELDRLNNVIMETGTPHTVEEYAVLNNGLTIYLSQKTPLRDKNNEIIGVLGISIDITERKKMEVALRRAKEAAEVANHAKTEFIATMSHDIHTPLNGIVGLSLLLEEQLKDSKQKQYAQWINQSGQQLLELLNEVLNVVSDDQIDTNDIHEGLFNVRKEVEGIVALLLPTIKLKNLDLNLEINQNVPQHIITDGEKLHRVLLNLIGNALKFTEQGSITIQIDAVVDDTEYVQLKFSISDTGIGIAPENQTEVFERFFRVNPTSERKHGGHGVGLYIAQNYVGLLGGEIQLESELGKGSNFYFTLPIKVANSTDSNSQYIRENSVHRPTCNDVFAESTHNSQPPLVLLIEANIVALRFMESLVIQAGFNFSSATDADHALNLFKNTQFDLILADVELPGSSGLELIRDIRRLEVASNKKSVPIIGLTTSKAVDAEEIMRAGVDRLISKPLQLKTMHELVDAFLKKPRQGIYR